MIQANELRIGNEVWYDGETWCTVVQIDGFNGMVGIASYFEMIPIKELVLIPLTPKILEKCGFTEHCEGNEYRIGLPLGNGTDLVIEVLQMETGPYDALISDTTADQKINCYSYVKPVKSLHQLQNLYSALTGEELEIRI